MKRASIKQLPPLEHLRMLFDYDPEDGILRWKTEWRGRKPGWAAGTVPSKNRSKYLIVNFSYEGKRHMFLAHRVIWKLMAGTDPPYFIDHIDGDKLNNVWSNLRLASHGQNVANSAPRSRSGFKGVYYCKLHRKWRAVVRHTSGLKSIGHYPTPEAAAEARHAAALRLQGQYARTF